MSDTIVPIAIAVLALIGSIASATVTAYITLRSSRLTEIRQARTLHFKYHNPILLSAHELQGRFYNIASNNLYFFRPRHDDYVIRHTIYLIGQYFAWLAILQKEVQFLAFDRSQDAIAFRDRSHAIREAFSSSHPKYGTELIVWAGYQTAIGEIMIRKEEGGQRMCMTYPEFCSEWDNREEFRNWFQAIEADLRLQGQNFRRMRHVQNVLIDLVEVLDPKRERYGQATLKRCRIDR
ncbi:hypothetical protein K438DRAFT_1605168 [Mycena galopus ATCC 62051]|nr:hypothetical protein K438DRAFT_1605168 [Mycena galopus ATCC 62051]